MDKKTSDTHEIKISGLRVHGFAFGGRAVGKREDGKVCFVRGAVPGEKINVCITSEKKNYSEGILETILEASPERIVPECPNLCPGCSYAHVPYSMELEWKSKQFRSFAEKAHLLSSPDDFLRPARGSDQRLNWRNKIRLSIEFQNNNKVRAGYRDEDNVSLIEVFDCPLAVPQIREALRKGEWKKDLTGEEKNVTFRYTEQDGLKIFFDKKSTGVLHEELNGFGTFEVDSGSFFQINRIMSGELAKAVLATVEKLPVCRMVELFCGCGCFSILCAGQMKQLHTFGIELDNSSIKHARENALHHGVADRCDFQTGDSAATFHRKFPHGVPAGTVILADPPRTGLDAAARKWIASSKADYFVYVSCSPDTLFRDLSELEQSGMWRICESRLLDMFPSTSHFESITLCKRTEAC